MYLHVCTVLFFHFSLLYKVAIVNFFSNKRFIIIIIIITRVAMQRSVYMGCSDVSEFEHIYGHIVTTSSCVYRMHSLHERE